MKEITGRISIFASILLFSVSCSASRISQDDNSSKIILVKNEAERKVDVLVGGKLFTSYRWPENVYKPILYPVITSAGTEITRGFPLNPREGERNDHIHQVGIWLNYGKVNGLDFWGNGHRGVKEPNGGEIKHLSVEKMTGGKGEAVLITNASWIDPSGVQLLAERTEYHFIVQGSTRIIDRITTLTAGTTAVKFDDTKEGMFGIRVARQLELPSDEMVALLKADGTLSAQKIKASEGATGNYRSSEGITGDAVWSTRAKWMDLYGNIGDEKISIVVCDHPENQSYPTYWHARGYGLFAANPLGWTDFTKGKEKLDFALQPGQSTKFRYRVVVSSGVHLTDADINKLAEEFGKKY
ncbi:MAG TPA: hypothetical protein DDW27_10070 [Bacteroidales bacterium]|nr:hypothetical protein [Bacteroidales bacterium]